MSKKGKVQDDLKFSSKYLLNDSATVKSGWLYKQGGQIKTVKKRYVILNGNVLYYFKSRNEQVPCGSIVIEGNMPARRADEEVKRENALAIKATKRTYYMWSSQGSDDADDWVANLNMAARTAAKGPSTSASAQPNVVNRSSSLSHFTAVEHLDAASYASRSFSVAPTAGRSSPAPNKSQRDSLKALDTGIDTYGDSDDDDDDDVSSTASTATDKTASLKEQVQQSRDRIRRIQQEEQARMLKKQQEDSLLRHASSDSPRTTTTTTSAGSAELHIPNAPLIELDQSPSESEQQPKQKQQQQQQQQEVRKKSAIPVTKFEEVSLFTDVETKPAAEPVVIAAPKLTTSAPEITNSNSNNKIQGDFVNNLETAAVAAATTTATTTVTSLPLAPARDPMTFIVDPEVDSTDISLARSSSTDNSTAAATTTTNSLENALKACEDGDTIIIRSGMHLVKETLVVDKSISIVGQERASNTTIVSYSDRCVPLVVWRAHTGFISNVTFQIQVRRLSANKKKKLAAKKRKNSTKASADMASAGEESNNANNSVVDKSLWTSSVLQVQEGQLRLEACDILMVVNNNGDDDDDYEAMLESGNGTTRRKQQQPMHIPKIDGITVCGFNAELTAIKCSVRLMSGHAVNICGQSNRVEMVEMYISHPSKDSRFQHAIVCARESSIVLTHSQIEGCALLLLDDAKALLEENAITASIPSADEDAGYYGYDNNLNYNHKHNSNNGLLGFGYTGRAAVAASPAETESGGSQRVRHRSAVCVMGRAQFSFYRNQIVATGGAEVKCLTIHQSFSITRQLLAIHKKRKKLMMMMMTSKGGVTTTGGVPAEEEAVVVDDDNSIKRICEENEFQASDPYCICVCGSGSPMASYDEDDFDPLTAQDDDDDDDDEEIVADSDDDQQQQQQQQQQRNKINNDVSDECCSLLLQSNIFIASMDRETRTLLLEQRLASGSGTGIPDQFVPKQVLSFGGPEVRVLMRGNILCFEHDENEVVENQQQFSDALDQSIIAHH